eukprot:6944762-Prymnesium_polylepis.1
MGRPPAPLYAHCRPSRCVDVDRVSTECVRAVAGLIVNAQFHEAPKTSEVTSTYFLKTKGTDAQQPSCPDGAAAYATSGSAFRSALTNETMDAPSHGANPSAWLVLHEKSVEDWVESYPEPAPTATQALQP